MGFSAKMKPLHCRALLLPVTASASCASLKPLQVWSLRASKANAPTTAVIQSKICSEQILSGLDQNNKTLIDRAKLVMRGSAFWSQKTDSRLLALHIFHVETQVGEGYLKPAHKAYFVSHSLMLPSSRQTFFLSLSVNTCAQDLCLIKPLNQVKPDCVSLPEGETSKMLLFPLFHYWGPKLSTDQCLQLL